MARIVHELFGIVDGPETEAELLICNAETEMIYVRARYLLKPAELARKRAPDFLPLHETTAGQNHALAV